MREIQGPAETIASPAHGLCHPPLTIGVSLNARLWLIARTVFGQVIRVEAGRVEPLYLQQPLSVDAVQAQSRHRLDLVEDAESQRHRASSLVRRHSSRP